jgi:hypothetical protein
MGRMMEGKGEEIIYLFIYLFAVASINLRN